MAPAGLRILWFRHGLRLHDNPSLEEALQDIKDNKFLALFIFDGESAGTKLCGYNRMDFLIECLKDLDEQLREAGSKLHIFKGKPVDILSSLHKEHGIDKLCFEQDCEPVWKTRDEHVKAWCDEHGVRWVEKIAHTLWNPHQVIEMNGGLPPVTFTMFNHVVEAIGKPDRPLPDPDFEKVKFVQLNKKEHEFLVEGNYGRYAIPEMPKPEDFGLKKESFMERIYKGGERNALKHLDVRLELEAKAFRAGSFLPNQRNPDILCPPNSMSPALRFGALSVRRFYWGVMDAFKETQKGNKKPFNPHIVAQLHWREFFYTMSVNNDYYDEMERNEICINIPWYPHEDNPHWKAFVECKTGFPFIDAGMKQMYKEGWIHHVVRNAIACFLTRGDLWISWEPGLKVFLEHLLDADWSVCAGNWMWISSSAFEQVLSCSSLIDPCIYGRRVDPWGEYIKRYLPELAKYPVEYIYEPWKAPHDVQKKAGCVIGKDYPSPIVDHGEASRKNAIKIEKLKESLLRHMAKIPLHCSPSNEEETREFMSWPKKCPDHSHST